MPHGKTHVATGAWPVQARAKPGAASPISRSPFAEARSPARVRPPRFMSYPLVGQRGEEFEAEAEAILGTDDGGQVRAGGCIELDFEQVAGAQQNASIQNHAALAQFSSAARNHGRRKPFGSDDSDGQINGNTRPAARLVGDKHSADHPLFPPRFQITEVQADAVQQYSGWGQRFPGDSGPINAWLVWSGYELRLGENAAAKKLKFGSMPRGALKHLR